MDLKGLLCSVPGLAKAQSHPARRFEPFIIVCEHWLSEARYHETNRCRQRVKCYGSSPRRLLTRTIVSICSWVGRDSRFREPIPRGWGVQIQLLSAAFGEHDENSVPVRTVTLNECSVFHARQLVRKVTFVPTHHPGQRLLPHLTLSNGIKTKQNSESRS